MIKPVRPIFSLFLVVTLPCVAARSDNLAYGAPCKKGVQVVDRVGYALGYSEKYEQPLWVSYRLTAEEALTKVARRAEDFRPDPAICTGSALIEDYRRSGYDRGHLAPAADMAWSAQAMSDCFYLSNMSPQVNAFNGGIWAKLEKWVRGVAIREQKVFVVTGPLFETNVVHKTIGPSRVVVPEYFYKVIYDETPPEKMIGFIVPNAPNKNIYKFAVSVDEVERRTGLDFFPNLPKPEQARLESQCKVNDWNGRSTAALPRHGLRCP